MVDPGTPTFAHRWLAGGLFALGAGLAANSLLGPLLLDVIRYHYSTTLINQGIGLDAVALFGAVPVSVAAGLLLLRGHRAGPLLAFVPTSFTAYMAPQYVVGPDYVGLPGNNEQFFLLHLGLFILAVVLMFGAWQGIDRSRLQPATRRDDRWRSLVLFGVAAFILLGRWLPGLIDLVGGNPANADYVENPTAYLLIGVLDLGLVVPAALAGAAALLRGVGWARTAAYAVIGWFALVPASVAAMAIAMQVNGDPNAGVADVVVFSVAAVVFTAGAVLLYRPAFAAPRVGPGSDRSPAGPRDLGLS
ncbi:MAG: hypothetical protein JW785_04770 [Acidimicrobiia bacterium]|nr:hypothetical protein [Acidimicrobiia bacterium]